MTDRTVKTTLTVNIQGYLQGMDQAARKTREVGSEADKLAQKRQAFQTLGVSALALGTAIAAGIGLSIVKFAEFDQAMSNANAILQESTENQKLLRDAALEAGGATVFTATESANAIEELGKAGIGTADILGGSLTGSLDLAASAQLGVARAAEITGITLKQFALDGSQASRVADVLSAGANKAVGSVEDLANGLKFVGPVAKGMNVSLEDTVATLALFADRGVIGEQAGTSLRGMLSSLTSPSKAAKSEMDRLNVSLYDGQGRFKGLENVAGELHRSLNGVTDAQRDASLGIIFGNQQLTTARVLVDAGAETWRDYRNAVDDSGIASRIAAQRMDNLAGDIEKLGGAFDTALIQTGSGANDVLRDIVQTLTGLVDFVGGLPEPVLNVGLAIGVVAGAIALAGGSALLAVPKVAAFNATIKAAGVTGRSAAVGIGAAGAALSAVTFLIGYIASDMADRKQAIQSFADSLDKVTGATTAYTRELVAQRLEEEGALDIGKKLGLSTEELVDLALSGKDAITEWGDARRTANAEDAAAVTQYDAVSGALEVVGKQLDRGREQWQRNQDATAAARRQTERNESALKGLAGQATDTGDAIEGLEDIIRGFGSAQFDLADAQEKVQAALDDFNEKLRENGATLDINEEAGRDNAAAARDIAKAYLDLAASTVESTGKAEDAIPIIAAGREEFIKARVAAGESREAAERYADQLGLIPSNVETAVTIKTDGAKATLEDLIRSYSNREISMSVALKGGASRADLFANAAGGMYSGGVKTFAQGGFESGIYGYTPGGIHKFAEAGDEAYMSFLPQYRDRNIGIWQESGERLGVWRQAAPYGSAAVGSSSVDQSVHAPITVKVDDPYVAAELVSQRLGTYLAVRR